MSDTASASATAMPAIRSRSAEARNSKRAKASRRRSVFSAITSPAAAAPETGICVSALPLYT
jgi:hypothetical protein